MKQLTDSQNWRPQNQVEKGNLAKKRGREGGAGERERQVQSRGGVGGGGGGGGGGGLLMLCQQGKKGKGRGKQRKSRLLPHTGVVESTGLQGRC